MIRTRRLVYPPRRRVCFFRFGTQTVPTALKAFEPGSGLAKAFEKVDRPLSLGLLGEGLRKVGAIWIDNKRHGTAFFVGETA